MVNGLLSVDSHLMKRTKLLAVLTLTIIYEHMKIFENRKSLKKKFK